MAVAEEEEASAPKPPGIEDKKPWSGPGHGQFRTVVEIPMGAVSKDVPPPALQSFAPGKVPAGAERAGYVVDGGYGRRGVRPDPPEAGDGWQVVEELARVPYRPPVLTVLLMPGDKPPAGSTIVGSWENTLTKPKAGTVVVEVLDELTPVYAFCIGHPAGYSLPVAFAPGPCPGCVLRALQEGWARLAPEAVETLRRAEVAPLGPASGCEPGFTAPTGAVRQDVRMIGRLLQADAGRRQKARDVLEAAGVLPSLDVTSSAP